MTEGFTTQTLYANGLDVVGDVNQRTHGTEFYGTSSNFVLLNQLFAFAREHHPSKYVGSNGPQTVSQLFPASTSGDINLVSLEGNSFTSGVHGSRPGLIALSQDRVSIINLLSNEEVLLPSSRPKTPALGAPFDPDSSRRPSSTHASQNAAPDDNDPCVSASRNPTRRSRQCFVGSPTSAWKIRLEKAYVQIFLNNLHHLHPMLDPSTFESRCDTSVWVESPPSDRQKGLGHFLALYNIVVAIGALIAGTEVFKELGKDLQSYTAHLGEAENSERINSSQAVSRIYFQRSKDLLGDTSAVCSLESAQTLLLMVCMFNATPEISELILVQSLYCQNSHMPHRCYMYCGQAVRTALAIGLANESASISTEDQKAARRTWWCIYSHEIDMSCSSGRRDSLRKPHNYQISLPRIKDQIIDVSNAHQGEGRRIAIINEMVHFAAILRRISKELYHDAKGLTMLQKSAVAKELDGLLSGWRAKLPEWLDFGNSSFRDQEWAGKQKLVLHLRFLNARILAHRLFLTTRKNDTQVNTSDHVAQCLEAARETIQILHVAYAHRHYFRTWWYNSTYTLYAGMIVLYVVMLRATAVRSEELLDDVIKAQSILQSMQEASVALRSAELLQEGLHIARSCIQRDMAPGTPLDGVRTYEATDWLRTQPYYCEGGTDADHGVPQTPFAINSYGTDPDPLFASLIDPGLLQDFTTGLDALADFNTLPSLYNSSYSN